MIDRKHRLDIDVKRAISVQLRIVILENEIWHNFCHKFGNATFIIRVDEINLRKYNENRGNIRCHFSIRRML